MERQLTFGEIVPGYSIPVLNNREIRAAAGIMFLMAFISLTLILSNGNFIPVKYVLPIFVLDFSIRLFVNPKYAPLLIIGKLIVRNQNPEYVGAEQKKFAWYIGFTISSIMLILMVVMNTYSAATGLACLTCLILMFSETAFGICLGCKLYGLLNKNKAQYCPGEICDRRNQHAIQRVSAAQWLMLLALIIVTFILYILFRDSFRISPTRLF
ncbi:uncharacterized protein DUF4395 [Lacibacter cauensis]|uniref:Uncharacterized protein DUF4395 n=1 Tax=Lacibacter cauensis TaxID=510947 RepID=A0A562SWX5_9BACT|nr:DUF4395 domain-containing protein [Lacibacter cauensis]TWI85751.1 uncharacterized protein DUF4395 [Lacibacter cauensis]